ncbi:MAG: HEAT repeat domain-containing protein, partial [Candidatus Hodarchaeales archaeon]
IDNYVADSDYGTLFELGRPAIIPFVALLTDMYHVSYDVSRCTFEALETINDPRAIEGLFAALTDENVVFRIQAIEALGMTSDPRAITPLIEALKDEDEEVEQAVVEALIAIGEPAIDPLSKALKSPDSRIRENAAWALEAIRENL